MDKELNQALMPRLKLRNEFQRKLTKIGSLKKRQYIMAN